MKQFALLAGLLGAFACSSGDPGAYLVVTVDARTAVHEVDDLRITLNAGSRSSSTNLDLGSNEFPVTFAVDATGRSGELGIEIVARDRDGGIVGSGSTAAMLEAGAAALLLDSVDFVVNTDFAGDQRPSFFAGEHGFQVAAMADGTWTTTYRERCDTPCNVYARRFDETGTAVESQVAAGSNAFAASSKLTTDFSTPATAASADTTVVVWNAESDLTPNTYLIACRAFDAAGAAKTEQVNVAADDFPNIVSVSALATGNFAIVWDSLGTADVVRAAIVRPDCSILVAPTAISTVVGAIENSSSAAGPNGVLYAWTLLGDARIRLMSNTNTAVTADIGLLASNGTEDIEHVRPVALPGGGYAAFLRWGLATIGDGPGRIDMLRVTNAGVQMGAPVRITDRSGSDSRSRQSFGVAVREDGSILVVWHACDSRGDSNGCGVFGQLVGPTGALRGGEIAIPTNTQGDQSGPSAVALPDGAFAVVWSDASAVEPDVSGYAVRARLVYTDDPGSRARPAQPRTELGVVPAP